MCKRSNFTIILIFIVTFTIAFGQSGNKRTEGAGNSKYADLVGFFKEWREFQRPKVTNGVPDYTAAAMEEQKRELKNFQNRLAAIDPSGWPISQQVDYHLVRAEMNGLEFYHRVIKPWSTDPDFYNFRNIELSQMSSLVLSEIDVTTDDIIKNWLKKNDEAELRMKLQAVPEILKQAKKNLVIPETKGDMTLFAIRSDNEEIASLNVLAKELAKSHPDLVPCVEQAKASVEDYTQWLKENRSKMRAPVGVGKENYNWWLKNVWLFPHTWEECWDICQHEYGRAVSTLKIIENKNRRLPKLELAKDEKEFNRRWEEAEPFLLKFVREEEIFTVPDFLVPIGPAPFPTWASNPGRRSSVREFFENSADRDPMVEIIHNLIGHDLDSLLNQRDKRTIRPIRRLYGVDFMRSEGKASWAEEMLMHAGLFDNRPRGKEVVLMTAAHRAVRGMAELKMHSNEFNYDEACQFDADMTPYGWSVKDSFTMWSHRQNTPLLPGYEMCYSAGAEQIDKLLADRAKQLGDKFNLRQFIDEFFAAAEIPFALIRWEMTGFEDEIKKLW